MSETRRPIVKTLAMAGLGWSAPLLGFGIAAIIGIVLALAGVDVQRLSQAPLAQVVLNAVALQILAMGSLAYAYLRYRNWSLRDVRVAAPDATDAALVVVAPPILYGAATGLELLATRLGIEPQEHGVIGGALGDPLVALTFAALSLLVIGPIEELLYRGIIQTSLRDAFGPIAAIAIAGAIFALMHLPTYAMAGLTAGTAASLGAVFVLGVGFGAIYEYRRNLVVAALVHGLYNALVAVVGYFSAA